MKEQNKVKPHSAYLKSLGKMLKECTREEKREYFRLSDRYNYHKNRKEQLALRKQYYHDNKDMLLERHQRWYKESYAGYRECTLVRIKLWFQDARRRCGGTTGQLFEESVGMSVEEFKSHIESQFVEGMSWDNWGRGPAREVWHIDHIVPVKEGGDNHHSNLRPLWAIQNYRRTYQVIEEDLYS